MVAEPAALKRSIQAVYWLARSPGKTFRDAAEAFGVRQQSVHRSWRRRFRDRPSPFTVMVAARNEAIVRMALDGMHKRQISEALGQDAELVSRVCREHGVKLLSRQQAAWPKAVAAVAAGASMTEAAVAHGVSPRRLRGKCAAAGVTSSATNSGRMDGRIARAIANVLAGKSPTEACRLELCSLSGLVAALRRRGISR